MNSFTCRVSLSSSMIARSPLVSVAVRADASVGQASAEIACKCSTRTGPTPVRIATSLAGSVKKAWRPSRAGVYATKPLYAHRVLTGWARQHDIVIRVDVVDL